MNAATSSASASPRSPRAPAATAGQEERPGRSLHLASHVGDAGAPVPEHGGVEVHVGVDQWTAEQRQRGRSRRSLRVVRIRQRAEPGRVLRFHGEVRDGRQRLADADDAELQEESEGRATVLRSREVGVRAIRGVVRAEERVHAARRVERVLHEGHGDREALPGLVARRAGLSVGAQAGIEESIARVERWSAVALSTEPDESRNGRKIADLCQADKETTLVATSDAARASMATPVRCTALPFDVMNALRLCGPTFPTAPVEVGALWRALLSG